MEAVEGSMLEVWYWVDGFLMSAQGLVPHQLLECDCSYGSLNK